MPDISNFLNLIKETAQASGKGKKTQQIACIQKYLDSTTRSIFEFILNPEHTFGVDKDMPAIPAVGTSTNFNHVRNVMYKSLMFFLNFRKNINIFL